MESRSSDAGLEEVASNEDGVTWLRRTGSARRARRQMATEWGFRVRRLEAVAEHMRPATFADCGAPGIRRDDGAHAWSDERGYPDDCRCGDIEEGWFYGCEPDHPDAIPVWRVETKDWGRLQRLHHRLGNRLLGSYGRRRRPCLWGGYVEREATWFDRKVLGYTGVVVLASRWLRLYERFWMHCPVCRTKTPHYTHGGRAFCAGEGHVARSLAEDDLPRLEAV